MVSQKIVNNCETAKNSHFFKKDEHYQRRAHRRASDFENTMMIVTTPNVRVELPTQ
jgi:hypothetical protein